MFEVGKARRREKTFLPAGLLLFFHFIRYQTLRLPVFFDFLPDNRHIPSGFGNIVIDGVHIPLGDFQLTASGGFQCLIDMGPHSILVQLLSHAQQIGRGLSLVE